MILLRHGQSEFNRLFTQTRQDPGIPDPGLTEAGRKQALDAAARLAPEPMAPIPITQVIVSPYTRALQTAAPILERLGLAARVMPLVRERYAFSCDIGSPRSALAPAWPDHDFASLDEVWWPSAFEEEASVIDRAARFRALMAEDALWRQTLVVTHWGFILAMTGQSVANGEMIRFDMAHPAPETIVWKA